jgi:hypothetical protein
MSVFFFFSCASYTTFTTPTVLKEKETLAGAGFTRLKEGEKKVVTEFYFRSALVKNMDAGLKFSGVPFAGGSMLVDLKRSIYQKGPFILSADLGLSYSSLVGNDLLSYQSVGIYPLILFGNDRLYGGMKYNYLMFSGSVEIFDIEIGGKSNIGFPSVVLGSTIGKRLRIQPEINVFLHPGSKPVYIYSIGFLDIRKSRSQSTIL